MSNAKFRQLQGIVAEHGCIRNLRSFLSYDLAIDNDCLVPGDGRVPDIRDDCPADAVYPLHYRQEESDRAKAIRTRTEIARILSNAGAGRFMLCKQDSPSPRSPGQCAKT